MNPRQKLITLSWCVVTMLATLILSHGHLILREVMSRWPQTTSWEGRLENALYTQGGLTLLASLTISVAVLIRGYFKSKGDQELARREMAFRERHERAAHQRHEELLESLTRLTTDREVPSEKKFPALATSQGDLRPHFDGFPYRAARVDLLLP